MDESTVRGHLLNRRTKGQKAAIASDARRLLVVAGAGSGKTDVMARRVAWWVAVEGVPKDAIVAFTFGEAAAEEMKFRIRRRIGKVTPEGDDPTLGGMYVGTIHGFCIRTLRELVPDRYHNYEILDDAARIALIQRGGAFFNLLGLAGLQSALDTGLFATIDRFLTGYDRLNQYGKLRVELPDRPPPTGFGEEEEADWCKDAVLLTELGDDEVARAFGIAAARYYAYLHCRRFLDFSTSQMELLNLVRNDAEVRRELRERHSHVVVDECQDINQVQYAIIEEMVGDTGHLTAVGDHRQAIYGWRGGRVEIMGDLHASIVADPDDGEVVRLRENFRSTPRILSLANEWAETIDPVGNMDHPPMTHGRTSREDFNPTHVGIGRFDSHADEAAWIVEQIDSMIVRDHGAAHDTDDGERGLTYGDIAVLLRSSTDARTYMEALQGAGIPAVFRAGPDLFSQPEVLLAVAVLARMAGLDEFYGQRNRSLRSRVQDVLGCPPRPEPTIEAACRVLRDQGFPLPDDAADRLLLAGRLIHEKIENGSAASPEDAARLRSHSLTTFLSRSGRVPRVFPQDLFHGLMSEMNAEDWDVDGASRLRNGFFHLGQLSQLIRQVESPGWTNVYDFRNQVKTLVQWGAENARTDEAPLLVPPDAVTITTIHQAKGLEFPVVFMADVRAQRFPSSRARHTYDLPYSTEIVDPTDLADNENYDAERRLMYVALTRAERYLFVTMSGSRRSRFYRTLVGEVRDVGGTDYGDSGEGPTGLRLLPSEASREFELVTSFSDLRYFLECPHDFYFRKVLGFAPGIDRAIGYGRGIHNLLRAVHTEPERWAELARDEDALRAELEELAEAGVFYLRYTTGEPAAAMRRRALDLVGRYVGRFAKELTDLEFEPERQFETLVENDDDEVLVSGAIDLLRLEDPPKVSLLDFKSGEAESDLPSSLDSELMKLQVKIYGLAAKSELEYEPERGLVRYLAEEDPDRAELEVPLDAEALEEARAVVADAARTIRRRGFHRGPTGRGSANDAVERCSVCDFSELCGLDPARRYRDQRDE